MPETIVDSSYSRGSAVKRARRKKFSPAEWHPGVLFAVLFVWVFMAEIMDMLILHKIPFTSSIMEGMVDSLILLVFISPTYLILFLPLKIHWQKERIAQEEIKLLSRKLLLAVEEERRKLAMELHDHFGQVVTSLQGKIEKIQRQVNETNTAALSECDSLSETVYQLGQDIRKFTTNLRPDMLDDLGLVETLRWYIDELAQQQPSLQLEYQAVGVKKRLSADREVALYRVCQESLNNIIRHANARHVSVILTYSHPLIILTIRDDGDGLPASDVSRDVKKGTGFGLLGMRERIAAIGGKLELTSKRGQGTTVRALVPVNEAAA